MPIYEYSCDSCGHEFEELVRGDEQPACPKCGKKKLQRQMSAPAGRVLNVNSSACPSREACPAPSHCCGPNCHMH